ncbi:MAG: hypothetical protein NC110_03380 [Ruminococcus sp.]|nr:hypothetical protein [Ruminococcus sp.]
MAIASLDKVYTKKLGVSNQIGCPACSKSVELALFESLDASPVAVILKKETQTYFAICPQCASVFLVNSNYITEKQHGTTCFMTADDLTLMAKNNG